MITVHQAAILLGGTDAWVRSLCSRGLVGDKWNGCRKGQRYTYRIVPGQLAEFMRISEEELMERLKDVEHNE